jgi:hypothetical protein
MSKLKYTMDRTVDCSLGSIQRSSLKVRMHNADPVALAGMAEFQDLKIHTRIADH